MHFLFILVSLTCLISMAEGRHDINSVINEASYQENRLHKKLLRSLQNTQIAVAYNDRWDQIKATDINQENSFLVRLVRASK